MAEQQEGPKRLGKYPFDVALIAIQGVSKSQRVSPSEVFKVVMYKFHEGRPPETPVDEEIMIGFEAACETLMVYKQLQIAAGMGGEEE